MTSAPIQLTLPNSITVNTPFGKMTFQVDISTNLVFAYLQQIAAAINARVASPSDKTIVIPPPPAVPASVTVPTPFGPMTQQIAPETLFILNALGQLAQGINTVWNG